MAEKITITVDGYDASQVQSWLTDKLGAEVAKGLDGKVTEAIEARVTALVDELTAERLKKEIDALLDEGWTQTDQWGNPSGKVHTLRDRVRGVFDRKSGSYSDSGSYIEKWVKDAVDYKLAAALKEELESAKARLRASFDEVLKAKFSATIRDALGLK